MLNMSEINDQLFGLIDKVNNTTQNIEINKMVEELIVDLTGSEYAALWIYNKDTLLRQRAENLKEEISLEQKEGLIYKCFSSKKASIYNYITSEKGFIPSIDNADDIRLKSKIVIPLIDNGEAIGIATAYTSIKKIKKFSNEDIKTFEAITPFLIDTIKQMQANNGFTSEVADTKVDVPVKDEISKTDDESKEILTYMANVVHDIRTPANGLFGFLEILQEQIKDERLKEYVSHAKNSAMIINELTTSLLDGVSSEKEEEKEHKDIVNTISFFSEVAELFSANMFKKKIKYNVFIDPNLPKKITIDSMKIKRIIMNLIGNASKFTPKDGSIEFSLRYKPKEKKVHIFIKDNGIGIAKNKQKEIFQAFKQASEKTKELYGGTGLGLSICSRYVQEMGGKLSLKSKFNKGSTFYFELPLEIVDNDVKFEHITNNKMKIAILMDKNNSFVVKHIVRYFVKIGIDVDKLNYITDVKQISDDITHLISFEKKLSKSLFLNVKKKKIALLVVEEKFLALSEESLEGAKLISQYTYFGEALYSFLNTKEIPKVLIVEDDAINATLLRTILDTHSCEIDIANNGVEGLELLTFGLNKNIPYDIVFTDYHMSPLSGADMLKKYNFLEKEKQIKNIVSVAISGDVSQAKELYDFDHFATKPYNKQEILSIFLDTFTTK